MSRFLITTFDERTWKKNEKILFLGEWCKRLSRKAVWSQLDQKVLPYHWDNRKQMFSDYQYLQEVYEKTLKILSQNLNRIHELNNSTEYWRIIIGPWLQVFSGIVFDRWLSIKNAIKSEDIIGTWIIDFNDKCMVPFGMEETQNLFYSNLWSHYIYSQIILANSQIPFTKISLDSTFDNSKPYQRKTKFLKPLLKSLISKIGDLTPDRFNKVVFISNHLTTWGLFKLQFSLGQAPYLVDSEIKIKDCPIDQSIRKNLETDNSTNEFEGILEKLIPNNIPKLYVELYSELRKRALKRFPKNIRTIVTTHGYWTEDGVKVWAAEKIKKGAKLVIGQHGGHLGSGLIEQSEDHQIKISHRFYTWGWKDENNDNVRPLPSPKLASVYIKKIKPKVSGSILWVWGANFPLNHFRMTSIPFASQCLEYVHDQVRFGKNISKEGFKILKLRLRPMGYFSWEEDRYLREAGFSDIMEHPRKELHQRLKESRLCVTTDNSTVFLETFTLNFPTILFWNPSYWELRSKALPFYEELRRVNILHDSPESAAALVNKIFKDPSDWWFQSERQKVIQKFCKEFAYLHPDWLKKWSTELKSLSFDN